jgi:uncharacterized protein YoxC
MLPFAFIIIAAFIVLAIFLIIRKSKGKKEINKEIVSEERSPQSPTDVTGAERDAKRSGNN